jgi:hypothetical protein
MPAAPWPIVIHGALLSVVHGHPDGVDTVMVPLPPDAPVVKDSGEIA